jgi:hypothetical protein
MLPTLVRRNCFPTLIVWPYESPSLVPQVLICLFVNCHGFQMDLLFFLLPLHHL